MAYFANGSSGSWYEETICRKCAHYQEADDGTCAVWMIHLIYNGEQTKNADIATMLDLLIPRRGVHNDLCTLYTPSEPKYDNFAQEFKEWLLSREKQ
jgi:hypothetical protein